ncbi:hypothetical protein LT85_2971 [Collimonas arenae]|uniref:Uncharacterized protein n=1 Tax=Collimonas arenae TaxID=279058 RepID=A0A0A1FEM8_9BURK|nr:hypothetical protein LT85_2971 [Collimonas arenae]
MFSTRQADADLSPGACAVSAIYADTGNKEFRHNARPH